MKRGDLYRVRRPGGGDPRRSRVFVVVSREPLIQSGFSTVICAPVFSRHDGLSTQVEVGSEAAVGAAGDERGEGGDAKHVDDCLDIRKRLFARLAIRRAAGQLGHLGDEGLVFVAPVDDDLVSKLTAHRFLQPDGASG